MARRWTLLILSIASSACGDDPTEPAGPDLSHLSLYPTRYVTVVGYGVELVVTARDLEGTELAGFVPSYTSSNSAVVRIEADRTITAVGPGTTTVRGSAGGQTAEVTVYVGAASYDLETLGPPRVLTSNYIDLSRIERISRFRSAIGHHYAFSPDEPCRSMKHYYQPLLESDWTTVDIYAPATGMVGLTSEGSDYKVSVLPREMPWLQVVIFHVNPDPHIVRGAWVEAGDHVGKHARQNTMSDIAMSLGPVEEGRLLSYFETMTDDVFAEYQARGVASRGGDHHEGGARRGPGALPGTVGVSGAGHDRELAVPELSLRARQLPPSRILGAASDGWGSHEPDHRALPWSNGPPDYALTIALRPGGARRSAPASRGPRCSAPRRWVGTTTDNNDKRPSLPTSRVASTWS